MSIKTLKISTALLATITLFGCDNGGKSDTTTTAQQENKILRIGSTGQSYPNGFIAKELGYTVEWTTAEFAGLMGQLDAGRLDTVANAVAITEARKAKYDFTQPYSYYGSQIVTHSDNTSINTFSDLHGKTISGVLGSNHIKNLERQFPNKEVNVKTYETRDGAMKDLEFKRVDGYINSKPILLAEIKRGNLPFKLVDKPLVIEAVGYAFARNEKGQKLRTEFDQALTKLKQDGTIKALSEKYYGADITVPEQ